MSKKNNQTKDTKAERGIDRKIHFESGGSLAEWRGLHQIHKSSKDKRNSRSSQKKKAVRESLED